MLDLQDTLNSLSIFKKVYLGYAPMYNQVTKFPSVSIVFDEEVRELEYTSNTCVKKDLYIDVILYGKQTNKKEFDDVLSDIIEQVDGVLNNYTSTTVFDSMVLKIENDKGLLVPYQTTLLKLRVKYI